MAFPPAFLDELRSRLTCSSVVGRRVRLAKKGREFSGLCPFHNEKSPSFFVNDDKGFFHCFGCGAHGDVIGFAMRIDNLAFPEAVERLAGEAGLEVPRASPQAAQEAQRRKTLVDVLEAASRWYEQMLWAPGGRAGLEYLRGRGLADATIRAFRLGWAPEGRDLLKATLARHGMDAALLLEAGLIVKPDDGREPFDFFRARVMFPITDRRGATIAFGGRILGDGQPKYLNSRDTPLFDKGRGLYALDKARLGLKDGGEAIVAEGYMDVIALHAAGFAGAVAPLGTALTEAQLELIWRLAPEPVICLDGDEAGQRAARRAAERALPLLKPGRSLRFAVLPAGEDPDSLLRAGGKAAFVETLAAARPLVDVLWEDALAGRPIDTPERRAALEAELDLIGGRIADPSVQAHYRRELRDRLWRLFRPAPAAGGPRTAGRTRGRGGAWGPAPPPRLGALPAIAPERRVHILLATVLNHPRLLDREAEALARLEVADPTLDRVRRAILDAHVEHPDLDSEALSRHLKQTGFGAIVSGLLRASLYKSWPFCRPAASAEEVERGWQHVTGLLEGRRLSDEARPAEAQMVENVSDASWQQSWEKLLELRNELNRAQSAQLEEEPPFVAPVRIDPKRRGAG